MNVTLDAAADAPKGLGDGRRRPVLFGTDVERNDAAVHSFLRTIQNSVCVSAISKPAFWYIDSGPTYCDQTHREGSTSRSEEHTSELQSRLHHVCRLLLEKKKQHKCLYTQMHNTEETHPDKSKAMPE